MAILTSVFKYTVKEDKDNFISFISGWDTWHPQRLAEDAATHFNNRNEDKVCWPLFFIVYTESGDKIGEFSIDKEMRPYFFVEEITGTEDEEKNL